MFFKSKKKSVEKFAAAKWQEVQAKTLNDEFIKKSFGHMKMKPEDRHRIISALLFSMESAHRLGVIHGMEYAKDSAKEM